MQGVSIEKTWAGSISAAKLMGVAYKCSPSYFKRMSEPSVKNSIAQDDRLLSVRRF